MKLKFNRINRTVLMIFTVLNFGFCASGNNKDKYYVLQPNFKSHSGTITSIRFSQLGTKLISSGLDKKIQILDLGTGKTMNSFAFQDSVENDFEGRGGDIYITSYSEATSKLFSGGVHSSLPAQHGLIRVQDFRNKNRIQYLSELREMPLGALDVSKSGTFIMAGNGRGEIALWQDQGTLIKNKFVREIHNSGITGIVISKDEKFAVSSDLGGTLILWQNLTNPKVIASLGDKIAKLEFSKDEKYLVFSTADGFIAYWSVDELLNKGGMPKIGFKPSNRFSQGNFTTLNGSEVIVPGVKPGPHKEPKPSLFRIDLLSGKKIEITPAELSSSQFLIQMHYFNGKLAATDLEGGILLIDIENKKIIQQFNSDWVTGIAFYEKLNAIEIDNKFDQTSQLNFDNLKVSNKKTSTAWSEKAKAMQGLCAELKKKLAVTEIEGRRIGDMEFTSCLNDKSAYFINAPPFLIRFGKDNDLKYLNIPPLLDMQISWDGNFLLESGFAGVVTVRNSRNFEIVMKLIISADYKNWLVFSPEGYLMGSEPVFTTFGWKELSKSNPSHIKFYGFDQFDLKFNRPDLLLKKIWSGQDLNSERQSQIAKLRKFAEIRAKQNGFSLAKLEANKTIHSPEVLFSDNFDGKVFTEDVLKLGITAIDNVASIIGYKAWVNGVPIYGEYIRRVYPDSDSLIDDNEIKFTEKINLSSGENKIEVSAFTEDGVESPRESFTVTYNPPTKRKPDLYFVGIGIDQYDLNTSGGLDRLTYAVKDSKELEEVFKKSGSGKFGKVLTKVITNKEVNRDSMKSLREFLKQSKVDDHVILFLSGHGIRKDTKVGDLITAFGENIPPQYKLRDKGDVDDVYFYMTSDANVEKPWEKAIPLDAIRDIVNGIPSRQKIMLVDTCQSGEKFDLDEATVASLSKNIEIRKTRGKTAATRGVKLVTTGNPKDKPEEIEKHIVQTIVKSNLQKQMSELFPELRRGTGTIEISAATGAQSALESSEWKNGAFTFVIKEAILKGKAKNKNGNITARSLRQYVLDEVERLTDGQQTPMVARDIAGRDFVIFGK